jgi:hypothetical protein
VSYVLQPQALGFLDEPSFFKFNLRYLGASLVLGLVLLPLVPALAQGRRGWWLLCAYGVISAATQLDPAVWPTELREGRIAEPIQGLDVVAGVVFGIVVLAVGLLVVWWRRAGGRIRPAWSVPLAGAVVLVSLTSTFLAQQFYLDHRYHDTDPTPKIYAWGRDKSNSRIAILGNFLQYPLYGNDLSNHVQYVGRRGPNGAFSEFDSCEEWRLALNRGDYEYAMVSPPPAFDNRIPPEMAWTQDDLATTVLIRDGTATLFRIDGELDPGTCDPRALGGAVSAR